MGKHKITLIAPTWPAPTNVKAAVTTRVGGVSELPYESFNLATHVDDVAQNVQQNRHILKKALSLPSDPAWLQQVHGIKVVRAELAGADEIADASTTEQIDTVCTVMTADCLPVLFCNASGTQVAAAHAGWRGLVDGVLETTVNTFQERAENIYAWLGPAIGPAAFEVGEEVRQAYIDADQRLNEAFKAGKPGKWYLDIYHAATIRLNQLGVGQVSGGKFCTYTEEEHFYSYRRDGLTGRMASMIWLTA